MLRLIYTGIRLDIFFGIHNPEIIIENKRSWKLNNSIAA